MRAAPPVADGVSEFADCIADLYEAASGEVDWQAALAPLGRRLDACSGILFVDDPAGHDVELLAMPGWPAAAVTLYAQHYRTRDPYTAFARLHPQSACLLGHEMVDPQALLRSEIWNEFGRHHLPAFWFIGVVAPLRQGRGGRLAWHRPTQAPAFGEAERALLLRLLPYLQRALQLRDCLRACGGGLRSCGGGLGSQAFDGLPLPLLVVARGGAVLACNLAAERACRAGPLRLDASGLHASQAGDERRLQRLLHDVAGGGPGGGLLLHAEATRAVCAVLVCRLPQTGRFVGVAAAGPEHRALVTIRGLTPRRPADPDQLCALFGLSAVEARIACAIVAGASVASVAAQRRTSPLTVRAQIRAILLKTGAESLRDLVAMVSRLEDEPAP